MTWRGHCWAKQCHKVWKWSNRFSVLCRHPVTKWRKRRGNSRASRERGGDRRKIQGKKIQTLFLEIVENPPQLHHMTFQKENATLLPPTHSEPAFHSISRRSATSSPAKHHSQSACSVSHPRTRSIAFFFVHLWSERSTQGDCDITNSGATFP